MSTQDFPELEDIPPAPSRSALSPTQRANLVPKWAAAVFSTFPLHTYPAAKAYSPSTSATPVEPILYVAPHLNRDGTLSALHDDVSSSEHIGFSEKAPKQRPSGWSSSDPIALRWQMELLFRQVDFEVRFIDPSHSWGPAKSMPFLHLPPHFHRRSESDAPSLLTAVQLPHLLNNYYPTSRPELGEKSSLVYPDNATELEARSWEKLLEGRIMAGVLLAVLLSPQSAVYAQTDTQPYLSALLSSHLQNGFFDQQLRRISALNPSASALSTSPTSSLPGWQVGFMGWIGATTASATSAMSTADLDSRGGGDTPGAALASPAVDQDKVVLDASAGLRALAVRTKSQLSEATELRFLLDASKPTPLDAVAFSVVHTVLTLAATPQAQEKGDNEPLRKLKDVLDQSRWLVSWSRQMWKAFVRDLDRA